MFYIHKASCISPQESFSDINIDKLHGSVGNRMNVLEPVYAKVSAGMLRRMSKSTRISLGASMSILNPGQSPDGIIIGTANGGMDDSMRFMKQIIDYDEGMLTPGSFVQSTANAIASQIGMITHNHGYNITHVHKGLAFENAMLDVATLLRENSGNTYLLGGADEIAEYNYNIEQAAGWYKKDEISNADLYKTNSPGSIAGEGAAMFIVSDVKENAIAKLESLTFIHTENKNEVTDELKLFLENNKRTGDDVDLFLTGENGDNRYNDLVSSCEEIVGGSVTISRFKHMCGEYPTSTAFALWLVCNLPSDGHLPTHMIKKQTSNRKIKNVLIYNFHMGNQHSFMWVSKMN